MSQMAKPNLNNCENTTNCKNGSSDLTRNNGSQPARAGDPQWSSALRAKQGIFHVPKSSTHLLALIRLLTYCVYHLDQDSVIGACSFQI